MRRFSTFTFVLLAALVLLQCGGLPAASAQVSATPSTGQSSTTGSGQTAVGCANQPCSARTGRQHTISPMTPEQLAHLELGKRWVGLFAHLEAQERLARYFDAQGNAAEAASWRADFARKSGLTPEEAETVKKIAAQFRKDQVSVNAVCQADMKAAREAWLRERGTGARFPEVPSCEQLHNLLPQATADLLTALGSRSFSRLDEYTRHMHDNARKFDSKRPAANAQQWREPPNATQRETPQ